MTFSEQVDKFKSEVITAALRENGWNRCQAARYLQMHRNTLDRYIAILKIEFPPKIAQANARRAAALQRAMNQRADACSVRVSG